MVTVYTLSLGSDNQLFPSQPFFLIVTSFYLSKQCLAPAGCPVTHVSLRKFLLQKMYQA